MDVAMLLFLALGLSMDAFAVSVSNGLSIRHLSRRQGLCIAAAFGIAQGVMPILGFFAGRTFSAAIMAFDHWIALVLLGFIGGKMVYEGIGCMYHKGPEENVCSMRFSMRSLSVQAVATSIDALAVGVGLALMQVNIFSAALSIACVTFVCCLIGVMIGRHSGALLREKAEILGGLILVGLGLKIFLEHILE